MKTTGNKIQERREALKMSRAQLAKRLKTSPLRLWRIETGITRLDADEVRPFARALKTSVESIVA